MFLNVQWLSAMRRLVLRGFIAAPLIANAALAAETYAFPDVVREYTAGSSLQADELERVVPGQLLEGTGKIADVAECGFWDAQYCINGLKVVLSAGRSRAYLYFPLQARKEVLKLRVGDRYSFKNCKIYDLTMFITEDSIHCQALW